MEFNRQLEGKITMKPKRLSFFDRVRLKMMMPNLKKYKVKYSDKNKPDEEFILVKKAEYELMKKVTERQDNYIEQIKINNKEIQNQQDEISNLSSSIEEVLEQLKIKESERRKAAGKAGGLTASLNKEREKKEQLLQDKAKLENTIELNELEIKKRDAEIKILTGKGRKKNIEDYKNYRECRHELEKRKREKINHGKI